MTILRVFLLLVFLSIVVSTRAPVCLPAEAAIRLNYGVIFHAYDTVHTVSSHWRHTILVRLPPLLPFEEIVPLDVDVTRSEDVSTRGLASPILKAMHRFQNESSQRLLRTLRHIHHLFPSDHQPTPARRVPRGWFNIIGSLSKSLFGTATENDVLQLQHVVQKVHQENVEIVDTFQKSVHTFASFMQTSNHRLDNLVDMQRK
jgi:hypothetical protein